MEIRQENTPLYLSGKTVARGNYDVVVNTKIVGCRNREGRRRTNGAQRYCEVSVLEYRWQVWVQRHDDKSDVESGGAEVLGPIKTRSILC